MEEIVIGVDLSKDGDKSAAVVFKNGSIIAYAEGPSIHSEDWTGLVVDRLPISRKLKWAQRRIRLGVLQKAKAERKAHENE